MDCIFCKIINNEIPSYKVYENDNVLAFLDINAKHAGHTLVIPKKHNKNILDAELDFDFFKEVQNVAHLLKDKLAMDGFNIQVNNEAIAGQEVMHMHFHIIPEYENEVLDKTDFDHITGLINA